MIDVNLAKEKNCKVPILVGGVGEKDFGNTYRQGNRIYSSNANAIAVCLLAQPVGNAGGWTCLYTVETKEGRIYSETDL